MAAAKRGYVDTIIKAQDTRKQVIGALEMLYTKREDRPVKKVSFQYKQWFLYAAFPLTLSAVLMFLKLPGLGEDGHYTATCIYATATYIFFGMSYTVLQIPYGSLASVVICTNRRYMSAASSISLSARPVTKSIVYFFPFKEQLIMEYLHFSGYCHIKSILSAKSCG